uniref:Glutathione S-transferase 1-like n=1 Tax=Glossina austeni TaxID=7395 RepID=A0A1A9VHV1_GLOAU
MGKLILYGLDASPPVRASLMTLKALDIPFEYKIVDLLNKEHLSEEYCAKNPQHTVPTLEDDGNFIWDSHAIMAYLVSKYGKDDAFYPKDLLKRALVDQRLHFESGVMFQGGLRNITAPLFFKNETKIPRSKIDAVVDVYNFLELFLKNGPYMAGSHLTIADFSIVSTVTSLVNFVDIEAGKYPKLMAWLKRMETLPYYQETNGKGAQKLKEMIKMKVKLRYNGKINLIDLSSPIRACLIDLSKEEHLTDEYCAKNPQHTVPTLEDDGHIIWDSHAIMAYLINKYGKENDSLYPKDLLIRAIIDQRSHLESGVIFEGGLHNITSHIFSGNDNNVPRNNYCYN